MRDGEVDTEFDASWIGECLEVDLGQLVEPVTFIGLFEVRDGSGPLFITGFSLDPENLAIDEPEEGGGRRGRRGGRITSRIPGGDNCILTNKGQPS
jgi:hypothetical protein